jgi:transcriptional regulator with XRE-family HTH domain
MSYDPMVTIATQVRSLRLSKNWSQEELAAQCGLHRTYVGAVERAERNITIGTLYKLADALQCDVTDLLRKS